jgi:hypothetical protein
MYNVRIVTLECFSFLKYTIQCEVLINMKYIAIVASLLLALCCSETFAITSKIKIINKNNHKVKRKIIVIGRCCAYANTNQSQKSNYTIETKNQKMIQYNVSNRRCVILKKVVWEITIDLEKNFSISSISFNHMLSVDEIQIVDENSNHKYTSTNPLPSGTGREEITIIFNKQGSSISSKSYCIN